PIVREADGLALSSRNVHLGAAEREAALVLSRTVTAAQRAAPEGPAAVLAAARAALDAREPLVDPDYLALVDPDTMSPLPTTGPEAPGAGSPNGLIIMAARVGGVRLIDNALIDWGPAPRQEQEDS